MERARIRQGLKDTILPLHNLPETVELMLHGYHVGQIISDCPKGVPSIGVILSGRVDVYSVAIDGRDVQLNSLGAGECFGICNLFGVSELETVLRCAENVELVYIAKDAVLRELESDAELMRQYVDLCNRKIQFLLGRIELLTMQSSRGKLLAFLLAQQDNKGCVRYRGSRDDLARILGISRATLFRELSTLQTQKVLSVNGAEFWVEDQKKLEEMLYQTSDNERDRRA